MTPKRVLVIHSAADLYGASKNLLRSLIAFKELGWETYTVLPHQGPIVKKIQEKGFRVITLEHGVLRRTNLNPKGLLNLAKELTQAFIFLSRLVKKEKIELVYTNSNANIIGGLLSFYHRLPHIWHIHEIILHPKWFRFLIERFIKWTGDSVFCVSDAVRKNLPSINPERLKLIYNGIELDPYLKADYDLKAELNIPENTVVIGMVARVHFWKGQFYFLEIASKIRERIPNVHFVMAGDAFPGYEYLYDQIDREISRLGLNGFVTDLGFRLDVPKIMSGLDIFILPSILPDPLPTTVIEAMAAKKPVVATEHGGAVEMVVHQETGYLIPHDDAESAAKIIMELVENSKKRDEMGRMGQKRATERFSIDSYIENFGKAVKDISH